MGIVTVDTSKDTSVTVFVQVLQGGTFRACRSIPAVRLRMPKTLASKAAHGVWDVCTNVHPSVAHCYCRGDIRGVECQDNTVGRDGAASSPRGDPPGLIYSKTGEAIYDLLVTRVTKVWAAYHTFAEVFGPVRRNSYAQRHLTLVTSLAFCVAESRGTKCLRCFRSARKLYLDRSVAQLVASHYSAEAIAALLSLEGRKRRKLRVVA